MDTANRNEPGQQSGGYRRFVQISLLAMVFTMVALFISLVLISVRLEVAARDIAGNAAPSIVELADASSTVTSLRTLLEDRLDGLGDPAITSQHILAERQALNDAVARYLALPTFPGEAELVPNLRKGLADVNRMADRIEALPPGPPVRVEVVAELRRVTDQFSHQLDQLRRFNASFLRSLSARIEGIRETALPAALSINLLGSGAAAVAVVIAFSLVRKFAARDAATQALLERRAAELDAFSAQVAHDLLSPLMTTNLALALVREKVPLDDEKTRAQLSRAEASLGHVRALVNGLLEFARAGMEPVTGVPARLEEVMRDVEASFLPLAERGGIELVFEPFEPRRVAASHGVAASMIGNLIQNSMRAVARRDVRRVVVRVRDEDAQAKKRVRVEVEDSGGGVDPDIAPLLFQRHARNIRGKASPGLGLGLATVKRLAEHHDGAVGFRSQTGVGATFWFTLPRVEEPD